MNTIYKIGIAIALTLMGCLAAPAQEAGKGIRISDIRTEIEGENLNIGFRLQTTGMELKCNGQLTLEFAVESNERRLVLPVVIYTGTQRYRYERRERALTEAYVVEPYHVYKGVKKNQSHQLHYKLSIPYYAWMEHASVTYREYTYDCDGDHMAGSGLLVSDINPAPVQVEPEIWKPNPALFPNLVCFLVPEVEEVKSRASMLELRIGFPVNVTEVRPAFGNNRYELGRADSLVYTLQNNTLLNINGVSIKGYASPEGRYTANERLARGRSQGFKQYLVNAYPHNAYIRNATTLWVPEDWDGLEKLVEESALPYKNEVLAVVRDGSLAPDTKEELLKKTGQWSYVYKPMLDNMFPLLRRIELKVDYTVQNLSDAQARELLYTHPELLSLEEIYRVARYYEPGSRQYREVYEIAARQYPNDIIANNNAAAALLQEGNADEALPYLQKTKNESTALINYGAYYYIKEDLVKANDFFKRAEAAGSEQASQNLRLINAPER